LSVDHLAGLTSYMADSVTWNYTWPIDLTPAYIIKHNCTESGKVGVVQILPALKTSPVIVYYCTCQLCLFAACKRHLMRTPDPSKTKLAELKKFMDRVIKPELIDIFEDFEYHVRVWYNHLSKIQQDEIDRLDPEGLMTRNCGVFCKGEKQQQSNTT